MKSNKQVALIVKEDGLIYLRTDTGEEVLCVDQEKAHGIIWRNHASQKDRQQGNALKPGIYPIPDLQWEVKDVPIERDPSTFTYYEREAGRQLVTEFTKVAILL